MTNRSWERQSWKRQEWGSGDVSRSVRVKSVKETREKKAMRSLLSSSSAVQSVLTPPAAETTQSVLSGPAGWEAESWMWEAKARTEAQWVNSLREKPQTCCAPRWKANCPSGMLSSWWSPQNEPHDLSRFLAALISS